MAVDIDELRRASRAIYAEVDRDVADDIARLLVAAADEIDRLRAQNNRMRHLLALAGYRVTNWSETPALRPFPEDGDSNG